MRDSRTGGFKVKKLRTKLVGAIMHGHFAGVFTHTEDLMQGSNVCIEVIHRMLCKYVEQGIILFCNLLKIIICFPHNFINFL